MTGTVRPFAGREVYFCARDGAPIAEERHALDLVGETAGRDVEWVVLPTDRLSPDFFQLRNGLAGAFLQKLVNYGLRAAFIGDFDQQIAASKALADFVTESNRGSHVWFVRDEGELEARLAALP